MKCPPVFTRCSRAISSHSKHTGSRLTNRLTARSREAAQWSSPTKIAQTIPDDAPLAYSEIDSLAEATIQGTEPSAITRNVKRQTNIQNGVRTYVNLPLFPQLVFLLCLLGFTACSLNAPQERVSTIPEQKMVPGSVLLAKKLPPVTNIEQIPLYGFLPLPPLANSNTDSRDSGMDQNWLEIHTSAGRVTAKNSLETLFQMRLQLEDVFQESYFEKKTEVVMVSDNPVWIASEEYFLARGLPVPPEGDSRRFLKGILGSHAIYLSNEQVIHSGPSQAVLLDPTTRVHGYRISPEEMRVLLRHVESGMPVIIR